MNDRDPNAFAVHRRTVRDEIEIAFVREGTGGVPLLLLHGWPGSKRLFWRNIGPLAEMGFEVIVPDQRGFGDTPSQGRLDIAASALDMYALVTALGHKSCVIAAGDMGSAVALDLCSRFPGFVTRQLIYNGVTPFLPETYAAFGLPSSQPEEIMSRSDHLLRHGAEADAVATELDTTAKRLAYVEGYFLGRTWRAGNPVLHLAGPNNFDAATARFQAEALADPGQFRASLGFYEGVFGTPDKCSEPPLLDRRITVETMILWGMADEIVTASFPQQLALGCDNPVGPYWIQSAGHFLQWEAAEILNASLRSFCRDLLVH